MAKIPLSVSLQTLGLPLRRALPVAQRLGVRGLEIEAVGELLPQQLSQTGRREIGHLLRSHDLEAAAIAYPLRRGLDDPEHQEARLDFVRQLMALSADLGPRVVLLHAGQIPDAADDPRRARLHDALELLARHGDRTGTRLAFATGLEPAATLADFLDEFDSASLGVHFHPAHLVSAGFDPYAAVRRLNRKILYVRAEDARRVSPNRSATVALGHGDLDWLQLLAQLVEIDYRGYLGIAGADIAEASAAVAFLGRVAGLGLNAS